MPCFKLVPSLCQLSVDSLAKLIVQALDPDKLKLAIIKFYLISGESPSVEHIAYGVENESLKERKGAVLEFKNRRTLVEQHLDNEFNVENYTKSEGYIFQTELVYQYLKSLIEELTSHSHCGLHDILFWSILPKLNTLYSKYGNKEMRKLIRVIVPWFVNPCLKDFNFCSLKMFTESTMFQAVYAHLRMATGLEKLVFGRSCYWRSKCIKDLGSILHGMKNLKILHIHYICKPEMLVNLSSNCPCLMELSLKGSQDITDNEIPLLTSFPCLHTTDISGTSITGYGCRILIKRLPNLIWLTHCPFNCNSDTLIFESRAELFKYIKHQLKLQNSSEPPPIESELKREHFTVEETSNDSTNKKEIQSDNSKSEFCCESKSLSLNLKSFWLFNTTTEELLLTLLCPYLEHLRLDFVIQDLEEEPDTSAIIKLKKLSSLFLYMYDRCPVTLVTSIVECGSNLTHLHLHLGDEWFFVAPILNNVARCCSNLTVLTMEGDYKGQHLLEESDSRLDFSLPPEGLKNLVETKISGCVSDLRLLHLLIQAPNLQLLHLDGELEWLHDDIFSEAIKLRLLLQLQELWFNVSTGVTHASIKKLLQSENNLQRVGRLCLMASATKDNYQDLLHFVRRNNLCTELIWVTDQREIQLKSNVCSE